MLAESFMTASLPSKKYYGLRTRLRAETSAARSVSAKVGTTACRHVTRLPAGRQGHGHVIFLVIWWERQTLIK